MHISVDVKPFSSSLKVGITKLFSVSLKIAGLSLVHE